MKKRIFDMLFLICALVGSSGAMGAEKSGHKTKTPIKHLIVIFQENVSFDHYFGTYPGSSPITLDGRVVFDPKPDTPQVEGFVTPNHNLLEKNPNGLPLPITDPITCDMDHSYTDEQKAYDQGKVDNFSENTEVESCPPFVDSSNKGQHDFMAYYDGRTVTALWNYAQRFAMSDNHYGTTFGPSSLGALNLVSGQTYGVVPSAAVTGKIVNDQDKNAMVCPKGVTGTLISDLDPAYDDASAMGRESYYRPSVTMTGTNIGEGLNRKHITWGWFQGGFDGYQTAFHVIGPANQPVTVWDYVPHHEPFQYYQKTANPGHQAPRSDRLVGKDEEGVNHQYDISRFTKALDNGNLPEVCFLKAPQYQNGHAGNSGPKLEQQFLVETINRVEKSKYWKTNKDVAIIVTYDDSDGWYDHRPPPQVNFSQSYADPFKLGFNQKAAGKLEGRAGYGPRLPFLVLSPWAKVNYVDHAVIDQTSIIRFIEDNWGIGKISETSFDNWSGSIEGMFDFVDKPHAEPLLLDEETGASTTSNQ